MVVANMMTTFDSSSVEWMFIGLMIQICFVWQKMATLIKQFNTSHSMNFIYAYIDTIIYTQT